MTGENTVVRQESSTEIKAAANAASTVTETRVVPSDANIMDDAQVKTDSTPAMTESMPVTTQDAPVKTESTPATTVDTHVKSEDTPATTANTPVKMDGTPATTADTPGKTKSTSAKTKDKPATTEGCKNEPTEKKEELPAEEKELEQDDAPDKRKPFMSAKGAVPTELSNYDALLNTCVSDGRIVHTLDKMFAAMHGAARASRGIRKGRYFYEVQVLSSTSFKATPEVRVGFSTNGSDLLGSATSIFFDTRGIVYKGDDEKTMEGARFCMETIGVLLNLKNESENVNTISLFIGGKRASKPIPLPEALKNVTLFPHVIIKNCDLIVNFHKPWCPLPFKAKMIDDAPKDDVEEGPKAPKEGEVVMCFSGNSKEWISEFMKEHPDFTLMCSDVLKEWARKCGVRSDRMSVFGDNGRSICLLMNSRKRNYVYALTSTLTESERRELCARFTSLKKTCYVNWSAKAPLMTYHYEHCSLPKNDEGFDKVVHETAQEEMEVHLKAWQKKCKLHSRCDFLKPGTFLKTKMAEFDELKQAYRDTCAKKTTLPATENTEETTTDNNGRNTDADAEKKTATEDVEDAAAKTKDSKKTPTDVSEWSEEDWMLLQLNVELHLLCHAFHDDVEDKERVAFSIAYLNHYYRLYFPGRNIAAHSYACQSLESVLSLYVSDVVTLEDGLVIPLLAKNEELQSFFERTEDTRNYRQERIGAGDETAALQFKAPLLPEPVPQRSECTNKGHTVPKPISERTDSEQTRPGTERKRSDYSSSNWNQGKGNPQQYRGSSQGDRYSYRSHQSGNHGSYQQSHRRKDYNDWNSHSQRSRSRQYDQGEDAADKNDYKPAWKSSNDDDYKPAWKRSKGDDYTTSWKSSKDDDYTTSWKSSKDDDYTSSWKSSRDDYTTSWSATNKRSAPSDGFEVRDSRYSRHC